jgi:hypothetical protein
MDAKESEEVSRARFRNDELYRLVYKREYEEPDWETLNARYEGRIGYMIMVLQAVAVHPYSAGKYYIEQIIDKIFVCRDDEGERLPDGSDPSLITYDDEIAGCD